MGFCIENSYKTIVLNKNWKERLACFHNCPHIALYCILQEEKARAPGTLKNNKTFFKKLSEQLKNNDKLESFTKDDLNNAMK